jgi:ATP-dependent Clp protease ATP-binding subunit ClpC
MSSLEVVILVIIAIFLGAHVIRALRERKAKAERTIPVSVDAPVASAAEPETLGPDEPPPLTARLHHLEAGFAAFAASSAHPRELPEHPDFQNAVNLLADPAVPLDVVMQYALGANWPLSCVALAALPRRGDNASAIESVVAQFDRLAPWAMYFALAYFAQVEPRPPVGVPVVGAKDWWRDNPMLAQIFREYFDHRSAMGDEATFGPALYLPSASPFASIRGFLERMSHPLAAALISALNDIQRSQVDKGFLTTFGRFWTDHDAEILIEPQGWSAQLGAAESTLQRPVPRSLLVSGEQLVGKTSMLRLLAQRLAKQGWTIFEASGADLMAGQQWFGQLEGRIRQAADEITVVKKLIWYIPDLLQLARSGTHQGQSASILDQLLPAMLSGRLVVWTEASPTAAARLLQIRPMLRSILEVVRLEPETEEATLLLARLLLERLSDRLTSGPGCHETAVACARQYLGSTGLPGSALHLIKLAAASGHQKTKLEPEDILHTLSQLTGLPPSILDNKERIDLKSVRGFFTRRVMGQDEAIACIVDRIAMLKAGLNDPGRPIGVLLFAGPTGTGKTELAKTTAEYLFGSVDRLIRLDMSEFQTTDLGNLVGSGLHGETESLVHRVRKQPFSVVLLDEFEKAHPRVWDLFLQVFDDGRLTDTLGQVADFRHCLIILTTNLGATTHQTSGFGFSAPAADFSRDQVTRAIADTYRPEFQNRLDKIIVFRPLTRELMRVILQKELMLVLDRRGLKERAWAVEWEASALEFLLEKGFSPDMGARPLKRAIDQYVIAPLAATIVERRFPEGEQFVFFRSDGRAIQAEFVDPDADLSSGLPAGAVEFGAHAPSLPSMILGPRGIASEVQFLEVECASLRRSLSAPEWDALKQRRSQEMSNEEFWSKPERHALLSGLALMDRVTAAAATAEALRARLERGAPGHYSRELVSRLALQLWVTKQGLQDVWEGAAIEIALTVEPALDAGAKASDDIRTWCRQLCDMYRAWSKNRHMQVEEIPGKEEGEPPIQVITGFGAHRTLADECGLHILEIAEAESGGNRATARVRLIVTPLQDLPHPKMRSAIIQAFEQAPRPNAVVRRYRRKPSPLVRNADGSWRSGRLDLVLRGDFDLLAAAEGGSASGTRG